MRKSSLNAEDVQRILDATMKIATNQCSIESDGTLTVQLCCREERLTVVGIKPVEYYNTDAVERLGLSLLDELEATLTIGEPMRTPAETHRQKV